VEWQESQPVLMSFPRNHPVGQKNNTLLHTESDACFLITSQICVRNMHSECIFLWVLHSVLTWVYFFPGAVENSPLYT